MSRSTIAKGKHVETLAEFVKRTREEKGFSLHDVEINSVGAITNSYVSLIEHGRATNPTPAKLRGLALGLGVSEEILSTLARGLKEPDHFTKSMFGEMFGEYERLAEPIHKKTVDYYLRQLIEMMRPLPKKDK